MTGAHYMNRVSVLLSSAEEERFAAYCDEKGYKKSTLIARLIREHLDRESFYVQNSLLPGLPSVARSDRTESTRS